MSRVWNAPIFTYGFSEVTLPEICSIAPAIEGAGIAVEEDAEGEKCTLETDSVRDIRTRWDSVDPVADVLTTRLWCIPPLRLRSILIQKSRQELTELLVLALHLSAVLRGS